MKVKNAEEFRARGQSSSSRSTKKSHKSSTRRRVLRRMSAKVRQDHRAGKLTYSQREGTVIPNPAIDPAKRVDFLTWFTSILPKTQEDKPKRHPFWRNKDSKDA